MEYLAQPIETCKYCYFHYNATLIKWAKSKKSPDEWFIDLLKEKESDDN